MTILSINKLLSKELKDLELQLKARSETKVQMINMLSDHIISSGGKRLRPIVLILSAYASDSNTREKLIDASVVVEFIHAATLLHDDVVDESGQRRGRATANLLWDNKSSILVGDYLFSKAFELMVETRSLEFLKTLAFAYNKITELSLIHI